ncbi:acyltransferase family protein [Microbulbifer hainanensis]|uniref:acyltransferase family protein n=1 Tax=Microbulbifer hainanensis TaxID=2735675 RepID=UPI00186775FC|nr:acyltransferase family protein [Microbulbifer hainanensis]
MSVNNSYRPDIDGLRAFAVLPVVMAHARVPGFSGGYVGVDIFFVISGYLITGILLREIRAGEFSLASFYRRRARRILPALFAVMLVSTAASWFLLPPDMFSNFAHSLLAALFFVSNFWFWRSTEDYFGQAAELEPLLHTWSLSVEEQFYIGFPLLLCLLARWRWSSAIATVAVLAVLSLAASVWATKTQPFANYFLTPTRGWELAIGALLAMGALPAVQRRGAAELAAAAGLAAILVCVLTYDAATPFPGLAALPPCAGAAALIWAGRQPGTVSRFLALPLFVGVGRISYSLYLWHWPVLVFLRLYNGATELPASWVLYAVVMSVALAWLSWKLVEQPFRTARPGSLLSSVLQLRLAATAAGVLVMSACAINGGEGFPERLPRDLYETYSEASQRTQRQEACMNRAPLERQLCEFGSSAAPEAHYLLWGDSHAAAFLPGYERWLAVHGARGLAAVKSACAPVLGVVRVDKGAAHQCDVFNESVMNFLEGRRDLGTVILVARWAFAVEGERAPGEGGTEAVLAPSTDGESDGRDNAALVRDGLEATVRKIRATGREVVIVKDTPEIGFSVPVAVLNAEFIGAQLRPAPSRDEVEQRQRRANRIIEDIAEEFDAQDLSPLPLLCAPDCRIEHRGTPLYRDDDHLSAYGARWLVPRLLEVLAKEGGNRKFG